MRYLNYYQSSTAVSARIGHRSTSLDVLFTIAFCIVLPAAGAQEDQPTAHDSEVTIAVAELNESSGMAFSGRKADRCWSHNDSGDSARLFAFDARGAKTGECRLDGASAVDWEDMAAFRQGDTSWLLVGDCGDNYSRRDSIELYLFEEPDPDRVTVVRSLTQITVRYADGPRDCESIAVDVPRQRIVLVTKSALPAVGVYEIALPSLAKGESKRLEATAERVLTLALPLITALDMDQASGDAWLCSYWLAFRFKRERPMESAAEQFSRMPEQFFVAPWKQIESLALDSNGRVWVTTEGSPARLGRLTLAPAQSDKTETQPTGP